MIYIPQTELERIELILANNYKYNDDGMLDDQIARTWVKYIEELNEELGYEAF